MSKLSKYLCKSSYNLSPDDIEEIVNATLQEAGAQVDNKQLLSLRIARVVSGVGHVKGSFVGV